MIGNGLLPVFAKPASAPECKEILARGAPQSNEIASGPASYETDWFLLLKTILDQRPWPIFLMEADMTVRLMNEAAHGWPYGLIVAENRTLKFSYPHDSSRLLRAMKVALSEGARAAGPQILRYDLPDGRACILAVSPLHFAVDALSPPRKCDDPTWFAVSVRSCPLGVAISAESLAATFGFTPAEASLAAALAQGLSLQEYAARENLKITTVRWHLQNIFLRTETRSQSGLIAFIISLFA